MNYTVTNGCIGNDGGDSGSSGGSGGGSGTLVSIQKTVGSLIKFYSTSNKYLDTI
jgi:hypothetical protein